MRASRKKTVSELRKAGYTFPHLTWIFNQWFLYVVMGLAAAVGVSFIFTSGFQAMARAKEPVVKVASYAKVDPEDTAGGKWALSLLSKTPEGVSNWEKSSDKAPRQPIDFDDCHSFGLLPETLLNTYSASGKEASVTVQIYGAGQAATAYQNYLQTFSSCWKTNSQSINSSPTNITTIYDKGTFFTFGDAIVFIKSDNKDLVQKLLDSYASLSLSTLPLSGCASLTESTADSSRSLYYNVVHYAGYNLTDNLRSSIDTGNIPTIVQPEIKDRSYMDTPEGPLPNNFPLEPKEPAFPEVPKEVININKDLTQTIAYQDPDKVGPGCGWAWTSQKAPAVDEKALADKKLKAYNDGQNIVDDNARQYVIERMNYVKLMIRISQQIEDWNNYVSQLDTVHAKWDWLNSERAKLKTPWYNYVQAHNEWLNFDNSKANAQKDYDNAVNQCNAANKDLEEWHKKWDPIVNAPDPTGTPTVIHTTVTVTPAPYATTTTIRPTTNPTTNGSGSPRPQQPVVVGTVISPPPTPVPTAVTATSSPSAKPSVPPPPAGCKNPPQKPAILDQNKPEEPKAPQIPDGVTLPDSWPKPNSTPTVGRK